MAPVTRNFTCQYLHMRHILYICSKRKPAIDEIHSPDGTWPAEIINKSQIRVFKSLFLFYKSFGSARNTWLVWIYQHVISIKNRTYHHILSDYWLASMMFCFSFSKPTLRFAYVLFLQNRTLFAVQRHKKILQTCPREMGEGVVRRSIVTIFTKFFPS